MVRETPKLRCWDGVDQGKEWDRGHKERALDRNQMLVLGSSQSSSRCFIIISHDIMIINLRKSEKSTGLF